MLGASNYQQAVDFADLYGVAPARILSVANENQALFVDGKFQVCKRVDYLTDELFKGRFDPNTRYSDLIQQQLPS